MLDKMFKAYDIRATYPDPLNEDAAWKIGHAVGMFFRRQNGRPGRVLVSRDMRPHSPPLCEAMAEGVRASGMDVADLGMCDTSFMYFAINHVGAMGGVQTTASHNPSSYNGFKISGDHARPIGQASGLDEIRRLAEDLDASPRIPPQGQYEALDLWPAYREHVRGFLIPPARPTRVVIDASNGMAGKLIPRVFQEGGGVENLEIVPINFEITGEFAHEPNPLVAENMLPTQAGVREQKASLGVCFDGDADRCMVVEDTGRIIGCDHLTALLSHHFVAKDHKNPARREPAAVCYDLRSSKVVPQTVRGLGARPVRSRVGHVFMKEALRQHQAVFGGELSGHFYFRDNYCADSGAIAFASVLSVLGQEDEPMSELIAPFRAYPQSGEINYRVEDKQRVMNRLKTDFADRADLDELDGVTIDAFDRAGWWFNVRPSNTEPLLRLNAEAKEENQLHDLLESLKPLLGQPATD